MISASNVHRRFGKGELITHVLTGIDLTVTAGEYLVIMGKSGAGKSTLMYQLSVLDTPDEGSITVAGADVTRFTERDATQFRLETLGYVFQDYALVPDLSAEENVMLPLLMRGFDWTRARETARKSIDAVGMAGKYPNLPGELSGGEQQRVAVARAISGKPEILFADEPTANLDSVSGSQVIDLITALNRESGQTVVMVTHEREYARDCDRILHMEDGHITSEERLR
jgi:putative ABC transport system ATP-binding protein